MKKLLYISSITLIASGAFCQGTFPVSITTNPDHTEASIEDGVKEARDSTKNVASVSKFNDALFPAKGKFHAGLLLTYTGITPPPAVIGDITYGLSGKFSVGVVGGTTGALALYGIRLNARLYRKNNFRLVYRMISVYYPERNGTFLFDSQEKHVMPWMLSMGVVDTEWQSANGMRWSLGMGAIETHCVAGMKMWYDKVIHNRSENEGDKFFFKAFFTLAGSVTIPVTKKLLVRPEVFAVFRDGGLIKRNEFKVAFPINAYVNIVYRF